MTYVIRWSEGWTGSVPSFYTGPVSHATSGISSWIYNSGSNGAWQSVIKPVSLPALLLSCSTPTLPAAHALGVIRAASSPLLNMLSVISDPPMAGTAQERVSGFCQCSTQDDRVATAKCTKEGLLHMVWMEESRTQDACCGGAYPSIMVVPSQTSLYVSALHLHPPMNSPLT